MIHFYLVHYNPKLGESFDYIENKQIHTKRKQNKGGGWGKKDEN